MHRAHHLSPVRCGVGLWREHHRGEGELCSHHYRKKYCLVVCIVLMGIAMVVYCLCVFYFFHDYFLLFMTVQWHWCGYVVLLLMLMRLVPSEEANKDCKEEEPSYVAEEGTPNMLDVCLCSVPYMNNCVLQRLVHTCACLFVWQPLVTIHLLLFMILYLCRCLSIRVF